MYARSNALRRGSFRAIGWLAVVAMLSVAVLGPSARHALAASVAPTFHEGNITACPRGYVALTADGGTQPASKDGISISITYSKTQNSNDTLAFSVSGGVVNIAYVKGGPTYYEYNYGAAGTTGDSGLRAPDNGGGNQPTISHSVFCATVVESSGTPSSSTPPTEPPASEPPASEPPASEPPATEPPASEPPASEAPASEPPASEPPASEPPASEPPASEPPQSSPAYVLITKVVDLDGDLTTLDDQHVAEGWEYVFETDNGDIVDDQTVTDEFGEAGFVVEFEGDGAGVTVTEVLQEDWKLLDAFCTSLGSPLPASQSLSMRALAEGDEVSTTLDGTALGFDVEPWQVYGCVFVNTAGEVAGVTSPPTQAPDPTATPEGSVAAATGAPTVTLPPTDGIAGQASSSSDSWRMVLIALAGLLASVLVMTPTRATRRR